MGKKAISDVESVVPLEATLQQFFQKTLEVSFDSLSVGMEIWRLGKRERF